MIHPSEFETYRIISDVEAELRVYGVDEKEIKDLISKSKEKAITTRHTFKEVLLSNHSALMCDLRKGIKK